MPPSRASSFLSTYNTGNDSDQSNDWDSPPLSSSTSAGRWSSESQSQNRPFSSVEPRFSLGSAMEHLSSSPFSPQFSAGGSSGSLAQHPLQLDIASSAPTASGSRSIPIPNHNPPAASASMSSLSPAMRFLSISLASDSTSEGGVGPGTDSASRDSSSLDLEYIPGYILAESIGIGGSSIIRRATSPDGNIVAVKITRLDVSSPKSHALSRRRRLQELKREAQLWSTLSHEHILPLFSSYFSTSAKDSTPSRGIPLYVYFVTLFCPAGSLFDVLQRSSVEGQPFRIAQDDAGVLFRQIVRGLRYLHVDKRLVHGDIKLENILVDESGVCKIADFGMARWIDAENEQSSSSSCSSEESSDEQLPQPHQYEVEFVDSPIPLEPGASMSGASGFDRRKPIHLSLRRQPPRTRSRARQTASDGPLSLKHTQSLHDRHRKNGSANHFHFPRGSLPYASPEMLNPSYASSSTAAPPPSSSASPEGANVIGRKMKKRPNPAQDIWALGVLLYVLLSGKFPFADSFEPRLVDKIVRGSFRPLEGVGIIAEDVLAGCICLDVKARWDIAMVDEKAWGVGWGDRNSPKPVPTPSQTEQVVPGFVDPESMPPTMPSISELATAPAPINLGSPLLIPSPVEEEPYFSSTTSPSVTTPISPSISSPYPQYPEGEEEDDADFIPRGRSTQPVLRHSHRPPTTVFRDSRDRDGDGSRSRSTSRPPLLGNRGSQEFGAVHASVLDPVTTRVSVSVERGRKAGVRNPNPSNGYAHHGPHHGATGNGNANGNANSNGTRSRTTSRSPSPSCGPPVTPRDVPAHLSMGILGYGKPSRHHGMRQAPFELGLDKHEEDESPRHHNAVGLGMGMDIDERR